MRTMVKVWKNLYSSLGQIDPKCPLGNKVVKQTMRPSEYKRSADVIIEKFNPQDSILEIGCGFGGLALEILKSASVKYTVVDNKIMLFQAKKFLGDKVEYIEAVKIETLQNRKFELFISHHCLSETPTEYRQYILENIIKNCQKISIRDLNDTSKPTSRMIEDGYEMIPLEIEEWVEKYFIIEKTKYRKHQIAMYMGERRK